MKSKTYDQQQQVHLTRLNPDSPESGEANNRPPNGRSVSPAKEPTPVTPTKVTMTSGRRYHYVLGRGGSGVATLLYRKRSLQERGIAAPDRVRYRAFDNDPRYQDLFGPGEYVDWSGVHLGNFLRAALADPESLPGLKRLGDLAGLLATLKPVEILIGGCRQNRPIGGALYECQAETQGDTLVSNLLVPTTELRQARKGGSLSPNSEAPAELETLIISSAFSAGGAFGNSGALMDAWLLSDQLLEVGFPKFRIDPVIYLAEVFQTNTQEKIQANTYQFFLELDAVYRQGETLPPLKIGSHWVKRGWPFTLLKLMNGVDEAGRHYRQEEVYAIEAECWRLSSFGPLADQLETLIPNVVDAMRWPYVFYSQNCHLLVLPVAELAQLFALRTQKRLFEDLRHQPHPAETKEGAKALAYDWLSQQQLTPRGIGRLFADFAKKQGLSIDLSPYRKQKLAALRIALNKYAEAKLPLYQEKIETFVDQQAEQVDGALTRLIEELLNQPDYSPTGVWYVLEGDPEAKCEGIAYFLGDLKTLLKRKLGQVQSELERTRYRLAQRGFILTRMFYKLFPRLYKRNLLKQSRQALSLHLQTVLLRGQIELVARLERCVQQQSQALITWETALSQAGQMTGEQAEHYARQRQHRPVYETNILSSSEEEALFADRADDIFTATRQGVSFRWRAGEWVVHCGPDDPGQTFSHQDLSAPAGLARFLKGYALGFWKALNELSLEIILLEREDDPVALIEGLKKRAAPLVSIDPVQHKVQQAGQPEVKLRREYILGSQFGKDHFFQAYAPPRGFEIVATGEAGKHRLELHCCLFNISPFALSQTEAYRRAHQRLTAAGHHLAIFDQAELSLAAEEVP